MQAMLTTKIDALHYHPTPLIYVLGHAMGFSRAFADALGVYAMGVPNAHLMAFKAMRPSFDDLRLQDLQIDDRKMHE
jgi:hypothetical protein